MTLSFSKSRLSLADIALLFQQLSTLISAGIPLLEACSMLKSHRKAAVVKLVSGIEQDLLSGKLLSFSLQRHIPHFNELIYQLTLMGEHTGKLEVTLELIIGYIEQYLKTKEQFLRTLFYPSIVLASGSLIAIGILIFIVPGFDELFRENSLNLPPFSKGIFYLSFFITHYGGLLLLLIASSCYVCWSHLKYLPASLPIIKHLIKQYQLARFARCLAITLNAGIPILSALSLAIPSNNTLTSFPLTHLNRLVRSGIPLHRALASSNLFPPIFIQMVKTGEAAGQLDFMLLKAAEILDTETERLINRYSQLLEPLILIILGGLIGGLVIGMYLPIFKLGSII